MAVLTAVVALIMATVVGCTSGSDGDSPAPKKSALVRVPADAPTIQKAVDRVAEGGMVLIGPGVYEESVQVRTPDVTVRGEDRNDVIIDGGGIRPYGVVGEADGVRIQNLTVRRTTFYGVLVTGLHDASGPRANADDGGYEKFDPEEFPPLQRFEIDHVTAYDNGLYGIYAFNAQHGTIADNYASGSADSGFYVGQCHDCDIALTGNVGERNAVGFENANASAPLTVVGNRFSRNRVGMTFLSDYQEVFIPQRGNTIAGNLVADNNESQTPEQADGGFGIGIGIAGGMENEFRRNRVVGHQRAGVVFSNNNDLPAQGNTFAMTVVAKNRVDVADTSSALAPGVGNCAERGSSALPEQSPIVRAGCGASTVGVAVDPAQLAALASAPRGISFLEVPAPPDQPGLSDVSAPPTKIADHPTTPDLDAVRVPSIALLADLVWKD